MSVDPELGAASNRQKVAIHEWLHGLGIGHPQDTGNGSSTFTTSALTGIGDDELDNDRYTVMSAERGGIDVNNQTDNFGYSATPMVLDIAALQYLYGSTANHTTDTTYTLTDAGTVALDIDGDDGSVSIGRAFYAIWDTSGNDTITYSGVNGVVINLNEATLSDTAIPLNIQDIINTLNGSTRFNQILPAGTAGEMRNDMIDADFFAGGFFSRVINPITGAPDRGGYAIANSLYATGGQTTIIENATGGDQADILIGNEQNNTITGNDGDDLLLGGEGSDTMLGGSGVDEIYGGGGDDTIDSGAFTDTVFGGTGNDTIQLTGGNFLDVISGGSGTDTLDASTYTTPGFFVNLDTGVYGSTSSSSPQTLSSIETVIGTANADVFTGTFATQTFFGGAGDDTFINLLGRFYDNIDGGLGTDTLDHSATDYAGDTYNFSTGILTTSFANSATVTITSIEVYLDGTGGNTIISAGTNQTLNGGGGDDIMRAVAGGETMFGGAGIDTLDLSIGDFIYTFNTETGESVEYGSFESFLEFEIFIFGGANDTITTHSTFGVVETVFGGGGNDTIIDSTGTGPTDLDTYDGGAGTDTIRFTSPDLTDNRWVVNLATGFMTFEGDNRDVLTGFENVIVDNGAGIVGDNNDNVLTAIGSFNNTINGGFGSDTLNGGDGNDVLDGDADTDTVNGEGGDDLMTLQAGDGTDNFNGGSGVDTLDFSELDFFTIVLDLLAGTYTLSGFGPLVAQAIENFISADNNDTLTGNADNNSIEGAGGDDTIFGGNGADTLNGGDGNDTLRGEGGLDSFIGGAGNDTFVVDAAGETVTEAAGGGTDTVLTSVTYALALGEEIENLRTTNAAGLGAIDLTGNGLANDIRGNNGINLINGAGGADTMVGFGGNDTYVVNDAGDTVFEAAGGGTDTILTSVNYALLAGQEVENLRSTNAAGVTAINLAGNGLANDIRGNNGINVINGGGGVDTLVGFGGNDTYIVDSAADSVIEAVGGGTDLVQASVSYALAAGQEIENLWTTNVAGVGAINLTGNGLANNIRGNNGNNTLNGGTGADTMLGFAGNDTYFVDNAGDGVFEVAGNGTDTVLASVSYTLTAGQEVENLRTTNAAGLGAIDLTGNSFAQSIAGNAGNNVLNGKLGSDTLNGGNGQDSFVFDTALGAANVDTILTFITADDTIVLENAIFAALGVGALAAGAFNTGAAATQADDRIIYDGVSKALLYDADGVGGAAAIQFASITNLGGVLSAADFSVI